MTDFSKILGSQSKVKVLDILCRHDIPLPLRQLAELSELALTPAKHAVDDLIELKVVHSKRDGNRKLIQLRDKSHFSSTIRKIFLLMRECESKESKNKNDTDKRASKILEFNSTTLEMIRKARKKI